MDLVLISYTVHFMKFHEKVNKNQAVCNKSLNKKKFSNNMKEKSERKIWIETEFPNQKNILTYNLNLAQ